MKNKLVKTIAGAFLGLLMIFGVVRFFVAGQEKENVSTQNQFESSGRSIEGVWKTTVTLRNCQTGEGLQTFRGLLTFNDRGTISETAAFANPALRSSGHGIWEKESQTNYSGSFMFLRFNADGSFAGTQKATQNFALESRNGNAFESTGSVQIFDADDNEIGTGCATSVGRRFQ